MNKMTSSVFSVTTCCNMVL